MTTKFTKRFIRDLYRLRRLERYIEQQLFKLELYVEDGFLTSIKPILTDEYKIYMRPMIVLDPKRPSAESEYRAMYYVDFGDEIVFLTICQKLELARFTPGMIQRFIEKALADPEPDDETDWDDEE